MYVINLIWLIYLDKCQHYKFSITKNNYNLCHTLWAVLPSFLQWLWKWNLGFIVRYTFNAVFGNFGYVLGGNNLSKSHFIFTHVSKLCSDFRRRTSFETHWPPCDCFSLTLRVFPSRIDNFLHYWVPLHLLTKQLDMILIRTKNYIHTVHSHFYPLSRIPVFSNASQKSRKKDDAVSADGRKMLTTQIVWIIHSISWYTINE